jgi:hypothetical protein
LKAQADDLGDGLHRQAVLVGRSDRFITLLAELRGCLLKGGLSPCEVPGEGHEPLLNLRGLTRGTGDLSIVRRILSRRLESTRLVGRITPANQAQPHQGKGEVGRMQVVVRRARSVAESQYRRFLSFVAAVVLALVLLPSAAFAGGGLKPSEAPLVTVGQSYFGDSLSHGRNSSDGPMDLWRLPPLLASDVMTIAWTATGQYAPELCLAQDVDDYSWGSQLCNGSERFGVGRSGSTRTTIQAKAATSAPFLEFAPECCVSGSAPYNFTVESIQHAIGVGLLSRLHIRTSTVLVATANLSDGAPVPDGLPFYLNASWPGSGGVQYTASSVGGQVSFPVLLPPATAGQEVSFTVTRPADPQYLEAKSAALTVKVARPRRLHCRLGFKKRRVHGKTRCMRVRHRQHHRSGR